MDHGEGPVLFLEKLCVSDPEIVLLHGQSFIAWALCNLVEKLSDGGVSSFTNLHVLSESMIILAFFQVCIQYYIHMELEVLRIQHTLLLSLFRSRQIIILILQTAHSDIMTHSSLLLEIFYKEGLHICIPLLLCHSLISKLFLKVYY